jgi:Flp pilus assembly pilin Flp
MLAITTFISILASKVRRDEKGQTAAEYLGIVVVVALVIATVVGSGIDEAISGGLAQKVGEILGN